MTNLTPDQVAQMEADLPAHRAAEAEAARVAENARRTAALEAIEPLRVVVQNATFKAKVEAIRAALPGMWEPDPDLANLTRNFLTVFDGLATRTQRRVDDNQLVPAPPATT